MRVLIVDDSRAMRKILREMLQPAGFDVVEARHGCEALQRLHAEPPVDLALVDWNMPEMNGLELVRALRAESRFAALPIVMVTTETELEQMTVALAAGANEYVMKPFGAEALLDKLRLLNLPEGTHA